MQRILFLGDSVTDAGRSRENDGILGVGYPNLVTAELRLDYPNQYVMFNRGCNGSRAIDLCVRIKSDVINLKPDVMSILVGINEVWMEVNEHYDVDAEKYFKTYSMLIEEIKEALPNVKIMIMEPFVLRGSGTDNTEEWPDKWDQFSAGVKKRAVKAREIAEKYGLTFIPLQEKFDEAAKLAPNNYWIGDGVHPEAAGHELIKREWIKAFKNL